MKINQEKVGAEVQGELFTRRRTEIPDAERLSVLQEKLYQKAKPFPDVQSGSNFL